MTSGFVSPIFALYTLSSRTIFAISSNGDLSTAYSAPSEDAKELDETTKDLIAALKEVLSRF